ncbi:MAG: sel1 repeat family protein [Gammaproteobacteria bacterium]|nr:sel1 repeat family protein [Gammaproteobacteria bacterium]MCD8542614.1 sel1 repeat family protein [Gammaproteobacteria bacterium]
MAITRPKACLIILGAPSLTAHDIGNLMRDARERGVLYTEDHLKIILKTGQIPAYAIPQGLRDLACHADAASQFLYAQQMEAHDRRLAALWYRRSAENGHPGGQFEMAQRYFYGDDPHVSPDTQLGITWITKVVDHPLPEAHLFLGILFIMGDKIVKNIDSGLYWCDRAVQANHLAAILFLAKSYEEGEVLPTNSMQAMRYYRQGAKLHDPSAMIRLAHLLSTGSDDNKREAIKWYKKSAQNSQVEAYWPLAELLHHFSKKPAEALTWYIKAADEGHARAQFIVSQRFKDGQHGCPMNIETSLKYLQMAANGNHTDAQFELAVYLKEGNPEQQDQTKALFYFKSAASKGHIEAHYQAGLLMLATHPAQAYTHFKQAAQQDHSLAQLACIKRQIQEHRDITDCLSFCEQLVETELKEDVSFWLARLLDTGVAGKIDKEKAYILYQSLATKGHIWAHYYSATMLESGTGVARNISEAESLYTTCHHVCFDAKLRLACLLLKHQSGQASLALPLLREYNQNYIHHVDHQANKLDDHLETWIKELNRSCFSEDIPLADTPLSEANYLLGQIYENGKGVKVDSIKALHYYQQAGEACSEACYRIGYIHESGLGVPKNWETAKGFYQKASDRGYELARKRLSWSYGFWGGETMNDAELQKSSECSIM